MSRDALGHTRDGAKLGRADDAIEASSFAVEHHPLTLASFACNRTTTKYAICVVQTVTYGNPEG